LQPTNKKNKHLPSPEFAHTLRRLLFVSATAADAGRRGVAPLDERVKRVGQLHGRRADAQLRLRLKLLRQPSKIIILFVDLVIRFIPSLRVDGLGDSHGNDGHGCSNRRLANITFPLKK
jgi:hypothetical protein